MPVLVPTAGQRLAVNGVDLSQYATIIQSRGPLMGTPKKRGKNVTVPGRHGAIRIPRKRYEPNDFVLKLLVMGANPDGTLPSGTTAAAKVYANADTLHGLFEADTVTLTRTMPDGSQRVAVAEVTDSIDWARDFAYRPVLAVMTIGFTIPGAFWQDANPVTQPVSGVTGTVQSLDAFTGATAPMSQLQLIAYGPVNNPAWEHSTAYVQYQGVLSSGQQLVLNTATWQATTGTGSAWSPDLRKVSFSTPPLWFEIDPAARPFQVKFTHTTGSGVSASSAIVGKRCFLSA